MTPIKSILRHINLFDQSLEIEREIEDEVRFHVESRTRDNIAAGMTPAEAEADALRRFGDYASVKAACRKISKERVAGTMNVKAMKGISWIMLGCGLTLLLTGEIPTVNHVGQWLIWIAIMWRLLIYLRTTQPDQHRIKSAEQPTLSITGLAESVPASNLAERSFCQVPAFDQEGRTPVERLISKDK
ncbi:MAG: permease prefix domain 1-containing protein [Acidobacteria bacterium]|nr:permease prefix domain 1-containing protein [Acidobacteriota bacterium]